MTACHLHAHDHVSSQVMASTSKGPAFGVGLLGASALLLVYFGLLTALSGWSFTLDQFREFWPYIVALATGFGVQAGLFTHLHRTLHAASGKVVAATGTTSGLAMLSCCTHYLVTLLPALGATGLVAFVGEYQVELFWFGLAANLAGIVYIGRRVMSLSRASVVAALVGLAIIASPPAARAEEFQAQTDRQGQVTVKVAPLALKADGWIFDVVFDTHSVALDHDVTAVAALIGPDGREHKPTAWNGDPAGGHHRKGNLVFQPLDPMPSTLILKFRNVGPVPERSFSWPLAIR
ncbi:hypothetical protein [Magnetospirillum sp. 64-120]|uniref:hypothetical protein n=1 Tax=Magnetospirillum sp. 64-120 TaxID=1895778 RepID=UPI0009263AFA|nr:hypothetical protein [Magnetospirillum sp. 64-120]OJX76752.1 MAG: hypothetical protein BGO92_10710 [Magnetospirillum sp. 64-120]